MKSERLLPEGFSVEMVMDWRSHVAASVTMSISWTKLADQIDNAKNYLDIKMFSDVSLNVSPQLVPPPRQLQIQTLWY